MQIISKLKTGHILMQNRRGKKYAKKKDSESEFEGNEASDFSFEESIEQRKQKYIRSKTTVCKNNRKTNHLQWKIRQEEKFLQFMIKNRNIFEDREERRTKKIFKQMGKFIGSRSPEQCRSHHQKYEQRCDCFDNIIHYLTQKIIEDKLLENEKPPSNTQPIFSQKPQLLIQPQIGGPELMVQSPLFKPIQKKWNKNKTPPMKDERGKEPMVFSQILDDSQRGVSILGI